MKTELAFKFRQVDIKINIFTFAIIPAMYLTGYFETFIAAFISIMLHELGHIALACLLKVKVHAVRIIPVGLNAVIDEMPDTGKQLMVYLGGPFTNILLSAAAYLFGLCFLPGSKVANLIASTNIYLAVFNLMPVLPLDGGRILKTAMADKVGFLPAGRYAKKISLIFAAFIFLLGIAQLYINSYNFSIFFISIYIIISLRWDETEAALMNVKSIIYRRSRLLRKGVYQARDLVVLKNVILSEIIKNMDFDRFHIIHVLDDDLKLVKTFTEQEIIDALFENTTDITFDELIKKSETNKQG